MREPYAIARSILPAGATEKFEYPFLVAFGDPSAIITYFENRQRPIAPAPNVDFPCPGRVHVFDGIVQQITNDLLQCHSIRPDFGQPCSDVDFDAALIKAMLKCCERFVDKIAEP